MALSSRGNPANAQYLRDVENDPNLRMHGNQPGVPTATRGTMSVTTNLDQLGPARYQTSAGPAPPAPPASSSRWHPEAKAQMDAIGAQYGRTWRDDEYDQWLGPSGYMSKRDVDGTGRVIDAYAGGAIDDYWKSRLAMHATGDYWGNGTTDGAGDAQMRARQAAGLQNYGFAKNPQVAALQGQMQGGTSNPGVSVPAPEALPTLNVAALNAVQQPTEQDVLRYLMSQERR